MSDHVVSLVHTLVRSIIILKRFNKNLRVCYTFWMFFDNLFVISGGERL